MSESQASPRRETYETPVKPSDIDRAIFLGNSATDNLFTGMMAIAAELWAVRRRQKILEAVLEKRGLASEQLIETYIPSAEETARWQAERDTFVEMIYEPFKNSGDIPYYGSRKFEPDGTGK